MDYKRIKSYKDYIAIEEVKNFSLKQTFECGQCFRFYKIDDTNYIVVAFEKVMEIIFLYIILMKRMLKIFGLNILI